MSYCRWSSDDFQSDVYVYESWTGEFVVHVAGNRVKFQEALPPAVELRLDNLNEWLARDGVVRAALERAKRVPIGLPHDGASFARPTASSTADLLEELRAMGYHVPQHALDALREEAATDLP